MENKGFVQNFKVKEFGKTKTQKKWGQDKTYSSLKFQVATKDEERKLGSPKLENAAARKVFRVPLHVYLNLSSET